MILSNLRSLMTEKPDYRKLVQNLAGESEKAVTLDAIKPMLLACLHQDLSRPMLTVTSNSEDAKRLVEELVSWCNPGTPILLFPELDVLPYERLSPDALTVHQRLRVLAMLGESFESPSDSPPLIVASAHAVTQYTLLPDDFSAARQIVKTGMRVDLRRLIADCTAIGYEVGEIVEIPGTISKRGGIIDIFSPNNDHPARIEFFGDEVESIRWFEPATQRSTGFTESLTIIPAREMLLPQTERIEQAFTELDLSNCSNQTRDLIYEDIELLRSNQWRDGLEFYAPIIHDGCMTAHFPQHSIVVLDDIDNIVAELDSLQTQASGLRLGQIERGESPMNFPRPYFTWVEIEDKIAQIEHHLSLKKWGDTTTESLFGSSTSNTYAGQLSRFFEDTQESLANGKRIIVVSQQANRLSELLSEKDIIASPVTHVEQLPPPATITLVHGSLTEGWNLDETILQTDAEIFGLVKKRRPAPPHRTQHEVFVADLSTGDYVVHIDHGIARFAGMKTMTSNGTKREYLLLEYADDDKLYVPSDQVDRVARYVGSGGYVPSLSRLNTQEWARTKQRVKEATVEMAQELLELYSSREAAVGIAFSSDSLWEQEMEASFPYEETPDQARTIQDVRADMENSKPMDRLVCGDVGYGKTEVAVRAAFKAVNNGMQAAVLVPTTVLAQQHFNTFTERLAAFPVTVEVLSRFRSHGEQQEILKQLVNGSIDICIGTHRLIQNDVRFNNLGLVVIDEEQKFGVAHKERLKKLRNEVDVLTLSATPIPRSLHMSLIGVRDMSTIETAPEERIPIKTYVTEYNDELVREAILRELDRDGQVFFVHNRVQSISFICDRLTELVPEARIAFAHGQMPEEILESVMFDFTLRNLDVLVCTTIIESGLDLPSANTLIINQSDKLGLTQLYHLRGRVGRGDVRAYAYLLYEAGKRLTEPAQKRLKTIFEATELGAGFQIAMKDLEIRGAGNILGTAQSGHIGAIGFDLYCRLLANAVDEVKSGDTKQVSHPELPTIDLPITAHIPEKYVADLNARIALYQRFTKIDAQEQIKDILSELKDRFGEVPSPVKGLLYGVKIKLLALDANIKKISTEEKQVVLTLGNRELVDKASLQKSFGTSIKVGSTQVRLDTKQLGKHWPKILEEVIRRTARQSQGTT